jgi:hypothetical protein
VLEPQAAWQVVYTETLAANTANWQVPISGTWSVLRLTFSGRLNRASVAGRDYLLQINGDTGTNYWYTSQQTSATTASVQSAATAASIRIGQGAGNLGRTDEHALFTIHISQEASRWRMLTWHFSGGAADGYAMVTGAGQWRTTTAITSVDLLSSDATTVMASGFKVTVEGLP